VAARGLDIPEINVVVQVGFPANGIEYYIHRSGRCGRAGRLGTSILIDDGEMKIDRDLFRLIKFTKLNVPESIASEEKPRREEYDSQERGFGKRSSYGSAPRSFSSGYGGNNNNFEREFTTMDYKKRTDRGGFNNYNKSDNYRKKFSREEEEY